MTTNKPEVIVVNEDNMRDEFDSWIEQQGMNTMKDGETYYHHATHAAWQAWKASRAAPDVQGLVEALEDCITWLEPYDDIKPRDWKTDRENLRRAHQSARAALATYYKRGGEA